MGAGVLARISEFSYTKKLESNFYKESKSNKKLKKKKKNLAVWRGGGGGVARVSDFFSSFFKSRIQV